MNTFIIIFIVLGALATAAVLVRGIILMATGKDVGGQKSNKLMFQRVGLQAFTVLLVVVLLLLSRGG